MKDALSNKQADDWLCVKPKPSKNEKHKNSQKKVKNSDFFVKNAILGQKKSKLNHDCTGSAPENYNKWVI